MASSKIRREPKTTLIAAWAMAVAGTLTLAGCKNMKDQEKGTGLLDAMVPDAAPSDAEDSDGPNDVPVEAVAPPDGPGVSGRRPACSPRTIPFNFAEPHAGPAPDAGAPQCSVERNGEAVITFSVSCTPASQWAGCVFALNQDFDNFDPDRGHDGVYALRFCTETPIDGAFNLWYEIDDRSRRFLPVVGRSAHLGQACLTRYWSPDDACYYDARGCGRTACGAGGAGGASAAAGPASGVGGASLEATSSLTDASASEDGVSPACQSYATSKVVAYSEWCTGANAGTVRLLWLKYYQPSCACTSDEDCPATMYCDRGGWFPGSACQDGGCTGICTD